MNKKLLSLITVSVGFFFQLKAQITITRNDFVNVGNQFTIVSSNPGLYLPGGTGSQTWDFTSLTNDGETVYDVQQPAWAPFASSYPTANMAFQIGPDYQFLQVENTGVTALGQTGFGGNIPLNPAEKILVFPSTINTTFNSTSRFKIQIDTNIAQTLGTIDSIRIVGKRVKTNLCDAYGNITTPAGTFASLRMKETVIETDSIFAKLVTLFGSTWIPLPAVFGIPNPIIDTTESYSWYANNAGFRILGFTFDTLMGASSIEWLKAIPTASGVADYSNKAQHQVYPNPTSGKLNISGADIISVEVFTLEGNRVKTVTLSQANSIDLDDLNNGNYLVLGRNKNNEMVLKQMVSVFK